MRDLAAYRARHDIDAHTGGFGPIPITAPDRDAWYGLTEHTARARLWVDRHDRPFVAWPRTRSYIELLARRDELDDVFDTAPDDQRDLITQLRDGQLTLEDTARVLQDALDTQGDRRQWILEHWHNTP